MKASTPRGKVRIKRTAAPARAKTGVQALHGNPPTMAADTDSVLPAKRADFWLEQLAQIIGPELQVELEPGLSLRATVVRRCMGQIQFVHMSGSPQTITRAASPESHQIFVIVKLDGAGSVAQDGRTAHLSLDTLCVCDGSLPLMISLASRSQDVIFIMPARQLREIFSEWKQITALTITGNQGPAALFIDLAKSLCRYGNAIGEESLVEVGDAALNLLTATLRALPPCRNRVPSHIESYHKDRIRNFVKEQLRDPNLSVESIAQAVGLSARYMHRLFSNENLPLMKWVWKERLEHCCRDLGLFSLRNRTVSEIAFFWGFNNLPHFSRAFRSRFGISPSQFRQQALRAAVLSANLPGAQQNITV